MKPWKYILMGMAMVIASLVCFMVGRKTANGGQIEPLNPKVDTLVIFDTIKVTKPVYVTRRMVDSVLVPVTDTIRLHDTLFVYLEKEQVRWQDSLSVVYASGINPQVDSVIHFTEDQFITKEIPVIQVKKTHWGLGVQAGIGAGKEGLTPYVGVGVSYNILSW